MKLEKIYLAETERLYLREITEADAEEAYDLNGDPEVLRYTGDEPFDSIEQAGDFLKNYTHYKLYGFGRWAVIRKKDGAWLGWCGLKYSPEINEHDIGYRFKRAYWNMGYATEAANVCLRLAFETFAIKELVGNVEIENSASIKVLEKLGFQRVADNARSEKELKYKLQLKNYNLLKEQFKG